jgi:hypothetical protein
VRLACLPRCAWGVPHSTVVVFELVGRYHVAGKGRRGCSVPYADISKMADVVVTAIPLKTMCLFNIRTDCVPRSKHSTLVIQNQSANAV